MYDTIEFLAHALAAREKHRRRVAPVAAVPAHELADTEPVQVVAAAGTTPAPRQSSVSEATHPEAMMPTDADAVVATVAASPRHSAFSSGGTPALSQKLASIPRPIPVTSHVAELSDPGWLPHN